MLLHGMKKSRTKPGLLAGVAMTPIERRVGRFLRAPDHDAGAGGAADVGAADAGAGAADAGNGAEGQADAGADAGAAGDGGQAADGAADAGSDDGDDGTALGGAAKKDGEEGQADGEGGDKAAEHVVPEAYELTAIEGMTIDADLLEEATPIFKEAGLSNEQANAILPAAKSLMEKTQNATVQSMIDAGNQQRKAWLDAAKADQQIGGNNWDSSLHSAGRALDALGHPEGSEFRAALNETGFGNHPEMIRIFARIGEMVGEDGDFVRPDAGTKVTDTLSEMYPNNRRGK